jgi:hypothetical protein
MILSSEPSVAALSARAAGPQSGLLRGADTVRLSAPQLEEQWVRLEVSSPRRDTGTNKGESGPLPAGNTSNSKLGPWASLAAASAARFRIEIARYRDSQEPVEW